MKRSHVVRTVDSLNSNYQKKIKENISSKYPTTIRRSVIVSNIITIDHSVNEYLYGRWIANNQKSIELKFLQDNMAAMIIDSLNDSNVNIHFIHFDPRTTKHRRVSY